MTLLFAILLLGCTDKSGPPATGDGDGADGSTPPDGRPLVEGSGETTPGETDGGTTPPLTPIPTYACPAPPADARVYHAGTIISDQAYYANGDNGTGWTLIATGISYVHDEPCQDVVAYNKYNRDVKAGEKPGEIHFEFIASVPGSSVEDWLGEHDSGGGYLMNPDFAAHLVKIGWRDGPEEDYHLVHSLPYGWTESTLCIGYISPDRLYLTLLWDPVEGPYRTNTFTSIDVPIWIDMEIWPTDLEPEYGSHRSCALTAWVNTREGDHFAGYSWDGQE